MGGGCKDGWTAGRGSGRGSQELTMSSVEALVGAGAGGGLELGPAQQLERVADATFHNSTDMPS